MATIRDRMKAAHERNLQSIEAKRLKKSKGANRVKMVVYRLSDAQFWEARGWSIDFVLGENYAANRTYLLGIDRDVLTDRLGVK